MNEPRRLTAVYAGVFTVSLAVLAYEVIINRMFALMFWYHFAFMIVSVALFGIGVGSLLVFFLNRFLKEKPGIVLAAATLLLAAMFPIALLLVNGIPLEMEMLGSKTAADALVHRQYFIQFFILLSLPFVVAGFVFSYLFTNFRERINRIYFFDLVGGGLGALAALLLFPNRGPLMSAFILAVVLILAAAFFAWHDIKWLAFIVPAAAIPLLCALLLPVVNASEVRVSKGKRDLKQFEAKKFSRWDNFAYVAMHERYGHLLITADYSCYTDLFRIPKRNDYRKYSGEGLIFDHFYPYVVMSKPSNVGIVGVGGGKDVLMALHAGAKEIYGAEFNGTVFDIFAKEYADYVGGISQRSNVHLSRDEGRFCIRSSPRAYDVLVFDNAVAQTAVSSGAFTIAESYLYTAEAFVDYLSHLSPGGVIYFSNPLPDATRFIPVIREAFRRMGLADEAERLIFVSDNRSKAYRKCKVLVKRTPFTEKEVAALEAFVASMGHDVLHAPRRENGKNDVTRLVTTKDLLRAYATAKSELRPPTDDWPFFTQRVKPDQKEYTWENHAVNNFYPEPFLMLREAAKNVLIGALVFLLFPLVVLNLKGLRALKNKAGSIFYFAALGLAFMFVEIVLMQKYMLILGHPVFSFSVVLSALLVSSGIGSLVSERFRNPFTAIRIAVLAVAVALGISFAVIHFFSDGIIQLAFPMRVIIVALLTSMAGVFMGFLMPSGIRAVSAVEESIPWLWSINSVFSTVAGFVSIYISILYGFTAVLAASVVIYILAAVFFTFSLKFRAG